MKFFVCGLLLTLPIFGVASPPQCQALKIQGYFDGIKKVTGPNYVIVRGDRIEKIAPTSGDCKPKDLGTAVLTPGLIDTHTHLFLEDRTYARDFSAALTRMLGQSDEQRLALARVNALSLLNSGFTSVRDLGNSGRFLDVRFRKENPAIGLFLTGPGLVSREGQFKKGTSLKKVTDEYRVIATIDDAKKAVREAAEQGVDWIKVYADNDPNPGLMDPRILKTVVGEAHSRNLPVAVHATSANSLELAVEARADSVEHVYEADDLTWAKMQARGIFMVPTDFSSATCLQIHSRNPDPYYNSKEYSKRRSQRLLAAKNAGVRIAFGSDMYLQMREGKGRGPQSIEALIALAEEGLSPTEALTAATSSAAQLLRKKDLGVIQPRAQADLVAFDGDPTQDPNSLAKVVFVMKSGKIHLDKIREKKKSGGL